MNTLDELIYYCNETEPVGALMLTGEWGCGKTYLLEHQLREMLAYTHILVRISLFGISSMDALNEMVKKRWLSECGPTISKIQDNDKVVKAGRTLFGATAQFIPVLKEIKDAILSVNPYDYIPIKPVIEQKGTNKRVVLIFDDLERTRLETVDVLGCINEYCENLHFNTIIVANEDRIVQEKKGSKGHDLLNEKDSISYKEIKEKIVCRTIAFSPDFKEIVRSIVNSKLGISDEYSAFLRKNVDMITTVFEANEGDEEKLVTGEGKKHTKPHNIRSLKCALQDFNRVFQKLKVSDVPNIERYMYSFLAYTISAKRGIAKRDEYGFWGTDEAIRKLYPHFDPSTLLEASRDWILYGKWDEEKITYEIGLIKERLKAVEPKDILKNNRVIELEEDIIANGFGGLLQDCYNGDLSLDEYVKFIENSSYIRAYSIEISEPIDWDKVNEGIHTRLEKCIIKNDDEHRVRHMISRDSRKYFTEDELRAYDLIETFRKNEVALFQKNRRQYLETIKTKGVSVFDICENKRFDVFDNEMAFATSVCFDNCTQFDKSCFPSYFRKMWQFCDSTEDLKKKETKAGFECLIGYLDVLIDKYSKSKRQIAVIHSKHFIEIVQELIKKLDVAMEIKEDDGV